MAEVHSFTFNFKRHARWSDLPSADQELLKKSVDVAAGAYAPYSKFYVGAALRLHGGNVVVGSNQENASFPAGICAERTAVHAAMALDPKGVVDTIAVVVPQVVGDRPVSPCGICRQALLEQEVRQQAPMRVLMGIANGPVFELASAKDLLPLHFDASFLKP